MNQQGTEVIWRNTSVGIRSWDFINLTVAISLKLNVVVYRSRGEAASGNLMLCGTSV